MANKRQLTSYVDAMKEASAIITRENPDIVVAPMSGSIPLVDAMNIVDRDFDPSKVVYMPASSRINDVSKVMRDWYSGLLDDVVHSPQAFPAILGIDEVVSGNSVIRCQKPIDVASNKKRRSIRQDIVERLHNIDKSISLGAVREVDLLSDNKYALELSAIRGRITNGVYSSNWEKAKADSQKITDIVRDSLESELVYRTIGIEDSKLSDDERHNGYKVTREEGRVIPVPVERIISMDDPNFSTADFERIESPHKAGYVSYGPVVTGFSITPQYLEFLGAVARHVGVDPKNVSPVNMQSILDSSKYLDRDNISHK
ncbi:MAG: hypothetical protein KC506_04065 [Nanoarchaeota archaeon]|nr:hypothetical protein [Nanoarchaeota archaeon]